MFYKPKNISKIMIKPKNFPVLQEDDFLVKSIEAMTKMKIGIACVINKKSKLVGVITDGDIRRTILKKQKPLGALLVESCSDLMIKKPQTAKENETIVGVLKRLISKKIWDLPVVDKNNKLVGLVHMQSLANLLYDNYKK